MKKRYLSNIWVPYNITDQQKMRRVEVCRNLIQMHAENDFLKQLVTVDETWLYWENYGSKTNKSWRGIGDDPVTTPKEA